MKHTHEVEEHSPSALVWPRIAHEVEEHTPSVLVWNTLYRHYMSKALHIQYAECMRVYYNRLQGTSSVRQTLYFAVFFFLTNPQQFLYYSAFESDCVKPAC